MTYHRLNLPWAAPPLNLNDRYVHPVVQANAVAQVRRSAGWVAKAAKLGTHDRVQVTLHYRPAVARERDEDNLVATLKPCCDGLVDAKLVINDTPQHMVKLMPVIHEPDGPGALWLDINILDGPDIDWRAVAVKLALSGVGHHGLSTAEAQALREAVDDVRERDWSVQRERAQ